MQQKMFNPVSVPRLDCHLPTHTHFLFNWLTCIGDYIWRIWLAGSCLQGFVFLCRWISSCEHLLCKNADGSSMHALFNFAKITRCHPCQQVQADSYWSPVTLKARIRLTSEEMLGSASLVSGLLEEGKGWNWVFLAGCEDSLFGNPLC